MDNRRSWKQRAVLGVGAVASTILVVVSVAAGYGLWKLDHIRRVDVDVKSAGAGSPENFLIVGSDSRAKVAADDPNKEVLLGDARDGQRSDTIMIARVDPQQQTVEALSIPRDLWVKLSTSGRENRINTAYSVSAQELISTIRDNLSIEINHYVEVDFSAFKKIVDALGGVPMWFDAPMRDTSSGLDVATPGCVVLSGDQALAFARSRDAEFLTANGWRTDPTGDLGRISRQQSFLRRIADRAKAKGFNDPLKAKRVLDATTSSLRMDKNLSVDGLLTLVQRFRDWSGEDLNTYTLPTYPYTTAGGAAVLGLYRVDAQAVLNHFRGLPDDALDPSLVRVEVMNRSNKTAVDTYVPGAFRTLGFTVLATHTETARTPVRTEIRFGPGAAKAADVLERHLSSGAKISADKSLAHDSLLLVVGSDFTTISVDARPSDVPSPAAVTTTTTRAGTAKAPATTAAPVTTAAPTTTVVGRVVGVPPDGAKC